MFLKMFLSTSCEYTHRGPAGQTQNQWRLANASAPETNRCQDRFNLSNLQIREPPRSRRAWPHIRYSMEASAARRHAVTLTKCWSIELSESVRISPNQSESSESVRISQYRLNQIESVQINPNRSKSFRINPNQSILSV